MLGRQVTKWFLVAACVVGAAIAQAKTTDVGCSETSMTLNQDGTPNCDPAAPSSISLNPTRQKADSQPAKAARGAENKEPVEPKVKLEQPQSAAAPELTEFQSMLAESVGKVLPMFGYGMFKNAPSTFAPLDHVPVTPDYAVGPGDEVLLKVWGQVDADLSLQVDRAGAIYIPKVGSVQVAGLRFQNLQGYLKTAIGRVFRNFDLEVNLGQLRSIQIYLVGQAMHPGSYTVSSLSTLVNALFASGGPSNKGSMRRIELKRQGKLISEFDLYDFLLKGDKSRDVALQSGDVIYIPPIGPVAAVAGSVNLPAVYELKGKTDLAELLSMSGGLATTAAGRKVELERIDDHKNRTVDEFFLDKAGLDRQVKDGDLVKVFAISPRFENAVTLRGNVANPFRYPWHSGMRVKDLIPEKEVLVTADYWLRKNQSEKQEVAGVTGLFNEIKASTSEINWDYAVIQRLDQRDLTTRFIPFNLGRAVIDGDESQNLLLEPGDVVTVFSKDEMRVPVAKQSRLVRIEGEFRNAGVYQVKPGETLRELVARIGGLTPNAYLFGAEFTRESTRELQQQRLSEAIDRMERALAQSAVKNTQRVTNPEDVANVKEQQASQKALLERMRTLRASGRIVLEIPVDANSVKDIPDIALEDGDRLYVPPPPSTVGVFGEVFNENNAFIYRKNKRVSDYIEQAGGVTKQADAENVFILRADGSVIGRQNHGGLFGGSFEGQTLMPGDAVVVPEDMELKTSFTKELKDWTQIFYQFGIALASMKAIKVF